MLSRFIGLLKTKDSRVSVLQRRMDALEKDIKTLKYEANMSTKTINEMAKGHIGGLKTIGMLAKTQQDIAFQVSVLSETIITFQEILGSGELGEEYKFDDDTWN